MTFRFYVTKILLLLVSYASIEASAQSMANYSILPRTSASGATPMVMLAMSNDHQLYYKAYTDYDDLNSSGGLEVEETSYSNSFTYEGYFESNYCYTYNSAEQRFDISQALVGGYCSNVGVQSAYWSGNFLNWATMTRVDILRRILYGGKRSIQTNGLTVLERTYLPNDAHSFAKYYNGDDLSRLTPFASSPLNSRDSGVTLCNTTLHSTGINASSRTNTNPPLMRAVKGNYSLWAAAERFQCLVRNANEGLAGNKGVAVKGGNRASADSTLNAAGFYAYYDSPAQGDRAVSEGEIDYVVRVVACPTAYANNIESCKQYPSSVRPIGLLHEFGEQGQFNWGLISGGYSTNKEAGLLRKNVDNFVDEVDQNSGAFITPTAGNYSIVRQLDSIRIAGWRWATDNDGNNLYNGDGCRWNTPESAGVFFDGNCSDWGNPIGEIVAEAYRYFSGAATPSVNADAKAPAGVEIAPWTPVVAEENYCSKLSVIALNTSSQSFDFDLTFDGVSNAEIDRLTDEVGVDNGLNGSTTYLVGNNGVVVDSQCTPKGLTNLSDAQGACPESPRLQGSWRIAGLAKYVFENDINSVKGDQTVSTFGLKLATALPKMQLSIPGGGDKQFSIVPACKNRGDGATPANFGNCAIVDFKVLSHTVTTTETKGVFYVNWEDSEFGGDYDQDMHGVIEYRITNDNKIRIKSSIIEESTDARLGFGYVLAGVSSTDDGIHFHAGVEEFDLGACATRADGCRAGDTAIEQIYTWVTGTKVEDLRPPLYYAARSGNSAPDAAFFSSNDPAKLRADLRQVLNAVPRSAAASASEVASTNSGGADLFLHTLYYSNLENAAGDNVTWIGQVGALFIDNEGFLREDTNGDFALGDNDYVIEFSDRVDVNNEPVVLKQLLFEARLGSANYVETNANFRDINYLWTTTQTLNDIPPANRSVNTYIPNNYATNPADLNVIAPNNGALVDFNEALFVSAQNKPLLGGVADANELVRYIRGVEAPNLRSRTLDGTKYLMGDIVGPSPIIEGVPRYSYDTEFGDIGYALYKRLKGAEARVVYTASNNGQIQAFHAGQYNAITRAYTPSTGLTIGQELWSFIPFNLLPHLQWLADPNYVRVPYYSGFMRTFDVKAFPYASTPGSSECTETTLNANGHICGWGTILVVGTGVGGGEFPVDADGNGAPDLMTRPAYIVLDVSNRTGPPRLIAEISHPELGFTTGEPDVIRFDDLNGLSEWFLVFGSGPKGYNQLTRRDAQLTYSIADNPTVGVTDNDKRARIFAFNIGTQTLQPPMTVGSSEINSFVGGVNGMDWNRDYLDDAIYFGTIRGDTTDPDGRLHRGRLTLSGSALNIDFSTAVNTDNPVVARPTTIVDSRNNYWVSVGTGRYYTPQEGLTDHSDNIFFSFMERKSETHSSGVDNAEIPLVGLLDTTNIQSFTSGQIENGPAGVTTIEQLREYIYRRDPQVDEANVLSPEIYGWKRNLENANERQFSEAGFAANILYYTTSSPETQAPSATCDVPGSGFLYQIDMQAGVPSQAPFLATFTTAPSDSRGHSIPESTSILPPGPGKTDAFFSIDEKGRGTKRPEPLIPEESSRQSWREIKITWE